MRRVAPASQIPVLVVGAGPTGLALALFLAHQGIRPRIVERAPQAGTTSRALAVQARTLELYDQIGIADEVVASGRRGTGVRLWVEGRGVAHVRFDELGRGMSPFPFALIYPQDEHEKFLIARLAALGVAVERGLELHSFETRHDYVHAVLAHTDGRQEKCDAAFLVGCDGAHSAVRRGLGFDFPGGTYEHLFYVADVEASGPSINDDLHVAFDRSEFLAVFPMKSPGHARLVGTVKDADQAGERQLGWADVSQRVIEWLRVDVKTVNWFSTFRVHHRVAAAFARGRVFLAGDSAHIHSPVGGQGMNTGIGDAINLAWKLVMVLKARAPLAILDSYEPERIAFARRLVATTDRAFTAVTSDRPLARFVRLRAVPRLVPLLFSTRAMRRVMFRTVSQTAVSYHACAFNAGRAGAVRGGDRLPWVSIGAPYEVEHNFVPLRGLAWQVHVYGSAHAALSDACASRGLKLHAFMWRAEWEDSGLARDALYLVRPDGYVAFADPAAEVATLVAFLDSRGLVLGATP